MEPNLQQPGDYPPSELVLDAEGRVYHLGLKPDDIADTIILVGDPGRVEAVSAFFDTITHRSQHREFCCHTGTYNNQHISVLSTGIGTDNIDIVINELDALVNINLPKRKNHQQHQSLRLVRIGTSGILQSDVPVHSYLLSTHAVGLDNVAHFYPIVFSEAEKQLAADLKTSIGFPATIVPYAAKASENLNQLLRSEKTVEGITVTASGFYGPQGRTLRLGLKQSGLNERLSAFRSGDGKVINFEMESSALFALGHALGHQCTTICLGIANRMRNQFSKGYEAEMKELIGYVLTRLNP